MTERISAADWRIQEKPRAPRQDHEHREQAALFAWAQVASGREPALAWLFAIPNGGHRKPAVAGKLRAEGVKRGVPDICLAVARGRYHGLFIELKADGGRPTPEQKIWIAWLNAQGYKASVCVGWQAARAEIEAYLELEKQEI